MKKNNLLVTILAVGAFSFLSFFLADKTLAVTCPEMVNGSYCPTNGDTWCGGSCRNWGAINATVDAENPPAPITAVPNGTTKTFNNCSSCTWSLDGCDAGFTACSGVCKKDSTVTPVANCQAGQTNICDGKCNTNGCNSGYTNCSGVCISTGTAPANCANYTTCGGCTQCNDGYTISNGACYSLAGYWALNGTSISNTNGSNLGFVGFGTTTPNSLLHLFKDSGNNAELDIQSVTGLNNHWGLYSNRADNSLRIWGGGDWLTILRNGNIGIGTTNPGTAKLAISGGNLTVSSGIAQISAPDALQDYTLELYQPYSASKPVRLRFHQGSVDWGRIELLGEVFHFKTGNSASEDYIGIRAAGITASSLTLGSSGARTAWPVDSPIFKSPVYGANGDLPVRTSSLTPMPFSMRTVYGPLSYAQPGCPAGTSKWYKLYAELVDNIQSGGDVMFKMDFESGSDVLDFLTGTDTSDVNMGHTYGASPSYRTYLSGLFQTSNIAHENSQMWLGGTPYCGGATCYGEIRRVELWAYCI